MKNLMKYCCILILVLVTVTGCGSNAKNLSLSAEEVIDKVYEGISSEDMPEVMNTKIDKENVTYYLGTDKIDFKEAVASEPMIRAMAYSVVVVKLNDGANIEESKKLIEENVDSRKWICVDAEIVKVDNIGNTIILIMMDEENDELANKVQANFDKLK